MRPRLLRAGQELGFLVMLSRHNVSGLPTIRSCCQVRTASKRMRVVARKRVMNTDGQRLRGLIGTERGAATTCAALVRYCQTWLRLPTTRAINPGNARYCRWSATRESVK